jgi:hypothetical protein
VSSTIVLRATPATTNTILRYAVSPLEAGQRGNTGLVLSTERRSVIDPVIRILSVIIAVMVLGTVVTLGLQGRLRDSEPVAAPSTDTPASPSSARLIFDDIDHPLIVDCRSGLGDNPSLDAFAVVADSRAAEPLDYRFRVRLLPFDGPAVNGTASVERLQPNQPTALTITIDGQPGVAADVGTFEACRVLAIESPRRVLQAD